jgi:hypothetical protein
MSPMQSALEFNPNAPTSTPRTILHQRSATLGTTITSVVPDVKASTIPTNGEVVAEPSDHRHSQVAEQIQQIRMLILGMDQRLQNRQEKLDQEIKRAEKEGQRYEELRVALEIVAA